ncbi:MAG TPA: MarR family winged helix-turn-helix transcriptional regulator [Mycobacterium sp.]|nr:MarR family winged helix-turn-helix transcriptional regulator [Mycobacterium sp.]
MTAGPQQSKGWSFLTSHAQALVCIAHDPGIRLREIAAVLDVTERRAFGIVNDLSDAGYVVKEKDGRRNRYRVQHHLPLPRRFPREPTIGEVLAVLVDTGAAEPPQTTDGDGRSRARSRARSAQTTKSAKRE